MLKRKIIAKLHRERGIALRAIEDSKMAKELRRQKRQQEKRRKEAKILLRAEYKRKYKEDFGDCKPHEPRETWANGPTTKPRSVLDNY